MRRVLCTGVALAVLAASVTGCNTIDKLIDRLFASGSKAPGQQAGGKLPPAHPPLPKPGKPDLKAPPGKQPPSNPNPSRPPSGRVAVLPRPGQPAVATLKHPQPGMVAIRPGKPPIVQPGGLRPAGAGANVGVAPSQPPSAGGHKPDPGVAPMAPPPPPKGSSKPEPAVVKKEGGYAYKPRSYDKFITDRIPDTLLANATLESITSEGNLSRFDVGNTHIDPGFPHRAQQIFLSHIITRRLSDMSRFFFDHQFYVDSGAPYDLDTGRVVKPGKTADFTWTKGVGLIPQNGAQFRIVLDFDAISMDDVAKARLSTKWRERVNYLEATVLVRTTEGRFAKLSFRHEVGTEKFYIRYSTWEFGGRSYRVRHQWEHIRPRSGFDLDDPARGHLHGVWKAKDDDVWLESVGPSAKAYLSARNGAAAAFYGAGFFPMRDYTRK
ncbi:MAG: hypothetical protein ISS72_00575 [Candidatus Brocadiae bacterium]|nr:hypothetical protein [Candidatus Brocadiia bacterium]